MVKKAKPVFVVGRTYRSTEFDTPFLVCKIIPDQDLLVASFFDGQKHNLSLKDMRKRLCSGDVNILQ